MRARLGALLALWAARCLTDRLPAFLSATYPQILDVICKSTEISPIANGLLWIH
jgi:hypothetical protein